MKKNKLFMGLCLFSILLFLFSSCEEIFYPVSFDVDGGSPVASQTTLKIGDKVVKPADPTKEGCVFDNWYENIEKTKAFNFDNGVSDTTIIYAKWVVVPEGYYAVTFDVDGGSAVKEQVIKAGEKAIKPEDPTKEHYIFDNWYRDVKKTNTFRFDYDKITSNTKLYAKWKSVYTGTEDDPFIIYTKEELKEFANGVNTVTSYAKDKYYKLGNDIDLGHEKFTPIGWDGTKLFSGHFDGCGFVVKKFKITVDKSCAGLFGLSSGTIVNLGVEGFTINCSNSSIHAGGLVGRNDKGIIDNCFASGLVEVTATKAGYASAGGLVGYNVGGSITNCYAGDYVIISATSKEYSAFAGGLVGWTSGGNISKCNTIPSNISNVTATGGTAYAGGLIGYVNTRDTITNCYANLPVYATGTTYNTTNAHAGGLIGKTSTSTVIKCYATDKAHARASSDYNNVCAGGLIGENICGKVIDCYSTATADASTKSTKHDAYAGGLVGYNSSGGQSKKPELINCYATGKSTAISSSSSTTTKMPTSAGGLVGLNIYGIITSCFAIGDVSATSASSWAYAGGLLVDYENQGSIESSYRYNGQVIHKVGKTTGTTPSKLNVTLGSVCTQANLNSVSFYTNTLKWSKSVWTIETDSLPKLK